MTRGVVALVLFVALLDAHASRIMASLPKTMKAVGLYKYLPISDENSLLDLELPVPTYRATDVLVEVKATAVNPVDAKIRTPRDNVETIPRILGWEGSGVVVAKGESANLFNVGDEVMFSGDIGRPGSNAQYMAVDQLLVGRKPKNLTFEQAAAMPTTALVAFESIYDRLLITEKDKGKSLLVINSAGGVGSVATQAAKLLGLKVIGTASRPESIAFTRQNGADYVLNHRNDLIPQLKEIGYESGVDFILVLYDPAPYWNTLVAAIKAEGRICMIVDSSAPLNVSPLQDKSITLSFELISTRQKYNTESKTRQNEILNQVSALLEEGKLKTTLTSTLTPINAANLREAHRIMEGEKNVGKYRIAFQETLLCRKAVTRRDSRFINLDHTICREVTTMQSISIGKRESRVSFVSKVDFVKDPVPLCVGQDNCEEPVFQSYTKT